MNGIRLKILLAVIGSAVLVVFLFVVHVWKQNEYIKLSKAYEASKVQHEKLQNDIAGILLDIKKLKNLKRLEFIGKNHFGMKYAGVPQFIKPVNPKK